MYCLELENRSSFAVGKTGLVCLAMFAVAMTTLFVKLLNDAASSS